MESASDPFELFAGLERQLFWLAIVIPVAIALVWFSRRRLGQATGTASIGPKGRQAGGRRGIAMRPDELEAVRRARDGQVVPIAEAPSSMVRVRATIVRSSESLGGPPERACVWRNRAGARPESAMAAELIVIADASGRAGVENLERARVIAPSLSRGSHVEFVSLYVGDEVEVVGQFASDRVEAPGAAASDIVYGTLGTRGGLEIRLIDRPPVQPPPRGDDPPSKEAP